MTEEKIRIIEVEERIETIKDNMPKFKEVLDTQQTVVDNFHEWNMTQMSKYDPVMVMMTILGQTLKIMKSTMPKKHYDDIMNSVYESKDRIEPFTKPKLH